MRIAKITLLIFVVLQAIQPRETKANQVMTFQGRIGNDLRFITVDCDPARSGGVDCTISGVQISHKANNIPQFSTKEGACFVEVGGDHLLFHYYNGVLVSSEAPSGMCSTHIETSIDFKHGVYTQRIFSDIHEGAFCAAQYDRIYRYEKINYPGIPHEMTCTSIHPQPTPVWSP
jgi:hypothetical protein